jgi:hypothetical protein
VLTLVLQTSSHAAEEERWPRIWVTSRISSAALRLALSGATEWLADEQCRTLFSEFRDSASNPLRDRLERIGVDEVAYLRLVIFRDGSDARQCDRTPTIMFTSPGGRIVYVCERQLEEAARQDREYVKALVIHEALHTLGLGENPPTSRYITSRVLSQCRR